MSSPKNLEELQVLFKQAEVAKAKKERNIAEATRLLSLAGKGAAGSSEDLEFVNGMFEKHRSVVRKFELENEMFSMLRKIAPEITGGNLNEGA